MLLSALAMVASSQGGSFPIETVEKFFTAYKILSVDLKVKVEGTPADATGTIVISRPDKLVFTSKWDKSDYTFVQTPEGRSEFDTVYGLHDDYPPGSEFTTPPALVSPVATFTFPGYLLSTSPLKSISSRSVWRDRGSSEMNGQRVHRLVGGSADGKDAPDLEAYVDDQGRLVRVIQVVMANPKPLRVQYDISNYKVDLPIAEEAFKVETPLGLVPRTVVNEAPRLEADDPFPVSFIKATKPLPERVFVVLTTSDCEVTPRAEAAIKKVADSGLPVVVISDSATAKFGYDTHEVNLGPGSPFSMGTPTFFLVDKGKIWRLWYGFDPEKESHFVKDVTDAVKELSATPE